MTYNPLAMAWMADADPHAHIVVTQMRGERLETVMAGDPAADNALPAVIDEPMHPPAVDRGRHIGLGLLLLPGQSVLFDSLKFLLKPLLHFGTVLQPPAGDDLPKEVHVK